MTTFLMFGKYSAEAVKGVSGERTKEAIGLIKKFGGQVNSMYAILGEYDLVLVVSFPGVKEAMKASMTLNKITGISFSTCPAMTVEEFDKMVAEC